MIGERIIKAILLPKFPAVLAPRKFSSIANPGPSLRTDSNPYGPPDTLKKMMLTMAVRVREHFTRVDS